MPLNVLVNERRLYLPAAAFVLGWPIFWNGPLCGYSLPIGGGVMVVFALLTFQRNTDWKDDFTLWKDALRKSVSYAAGSSLHGKCPQGRGF